MVSLLDNRVREPYFQILQSRDETNSDMRTAGIERQYRKITARKDYNHKGGHRGCTLFLENRDIGSGMKPWTLVRSMGGPWDDKRQSQV